METEKLKIYTIPNFLTLGNLLCGVLMIYLGTSTGISMKIILLIMFLGMLFDFADGFVARLLKQTSPIGLQLDSLADMVTFGVAPAILLFTKTLNIISQSPETNSLIEVLACSPLMIIAFSALRLAKFNVDDRQTDTFMGLPTPANAMMIAPLALYIDEMTEYCLFYQTPSIISIVIGITVISIISSFMLVSDVPMFSLKLKNYTFAKNKTLYLFLIYSAALLITGDVFYVLPLIIFSYIILSLVLLAINKKKRNEP